MDLSGMLVSTVLIAFSYILVYLDGTVTITSFGYHPDV